MAASQDTEQALGWGSLALSGEMKRVQQHWREGWGTSQRPSGPVQCILQVFKQEQNTPKEVFEIRAEG